MIGRTQSATQPRDDKGQYAATGRPSRRDNGWRTEPGYEDDPGTSDDEPDTPSEAKAKPSRPATPAGEGQSWRDKRRAKAEAAGVKAERTRANRRRSRQRDVEKHGRVGTAKNRAIKAGRPADRAANRVAGRLVKAGAKKLAKTIDNSEVI